MDVRKSSLPRAIWALGLTSLFMDVSSEMIHGLLPLYITSVMGAGTIAVGLIEGVAEATALIVKVFSGVISDLTGKRKLLALLGYGLAAATKPIFPLAPSLGWIISARFIDRIGKGIRGAPRDALVAELAPPDRIGAAFGLRQALDTVGAMIGPLIAVGLMLLTGNAFVIVFWVAVIPAVLAVLTLALFVPERTSDAQTARKTLITSAAIRALPQTFWIALMVGALLSLARISDAFLILRLVDLETPIAFAPLVLVAMNLIYAGWAYPLGHLSDRVSHKTMLAAGIVALIIADLLLSSATGLVGSGIGLVLWGLHLALTQGLLASMIGASAPASMRGTAFGLFNFASGIAMLVGNGVAGLVWDKFSPSATFILSAFLAATSALALIRLQPDRLATR